jgi:hypothetical protein
MFAMLMVILIVAPEIGIATRTVEYEWRYRHLVVRYTDNFGTPWSEDVVEAALLEKLGHFGRVTESYISDLLFASGAKLPDRIFVCFIPSSWNAPPPYWKKDKPSITVKGYDLETAFKEINRTLKEYATEVSDYIISGFKGAEARFTDCYQPVISPSGFKLAFRSWRRKRLNLFAYERGWREPKRITHLETPINPHETLEGVLGEMVEWSPDGRFIAFTAGLKLFICDSDHWRPRKLSDRPVSNFIWSPDSMRMALEFIDLHTDEIEIAVVDLPGGETRKVPLEIAYPRLVSISPDSRYLAIRNTRYNPIGGEILLFNLPELKEVGKIEVKERWSGFVWGRDRVFAVKFSSGRKDSYRERVLTGKVGSDELREIFTSSERMTLLSVSKDGRSLLVRTDKGIFTLGPEGLREIGLKPTLHRFTMNSGPFGRYWSGADARSDRLHTFKVMTADEETLKRLISDGLIPGRKSVFKTDKEVIWIVPERSPVLDMLESVAKGWGYIDRVDMNVLNDVVLSYSPYGSRYTLLSPDTGEIPMWKVKGIGDELRVELSRLGLENRFSNSYGWLKRWVPKLTMLLEMAWDDRDKMPDQIKKALREMETETKWRFNPFGVTMGCGNGLIYIKAVYLQQREEIAYLRYKLALLESELTGEERKGEIERARRKWEEAKKELEKFDETTRIID